MQEEGVTQKFFYTARLLTLLYTIFDRKGTLNSYPFY